MKKRLQELDLWFQNKAKEMGLDFFPISWEVVPEEVLLEIMTYALPRRFSHWSHGQSYQYQKLNGEMGLSKVYELILNSNPSYAFLLETNSDIANIMVMAHCYGHSHYFKNNYLFKDTDRQMVYHAGERADRVDDYIAQYGLEKVEHILDIALSMEKNIDWHLGLNRKFYPPRKKVMKVKKVGEFDDLYASDSTGYQEVILNDNFPPQHEYDLLWFLANYADLEPWQKDIFEIVREESFYFYPQYLTKTMNEGIACLSENSLIFTEDGILPIKSIVDRGGQVFDGFKLQTVNAGFKTKLKNGIKITTKRGHILEGGEEHRIMNTQNEWVELNKLCISDKVLTPFGMNIWSNSLVEIKYDFSIENYSQVLKKHGLNWSTYRRYLSKSAKTKPKNIKKIESATLEINKCIKQSNSSRRKIISIPQFVDKDFARFLGYLTGDGHISYAGRNFGLTSGDRESIDDFEYLCKKLFNLSCKIKWDGSSKNGRWRILCYSIQALDFLTKYIGLPHGVAAKKKTIPECILKSPKNIISEFLKSYYDCDGCVSKSGDIILSTSSDKMSEQIQIVLGNYGIQSSRKKSKDQCWQIKFSKRYVKTFNDEIGFGLKRKTQRIENYLKNVKKYKYTSNFSYDEIIKIEPIIDNFYDISVNETHRYLSNGFMNHNCFIHTELMYLLSNELLSHEEYLEFVKIHERVVQPGSSKLEINPYFLGFTILNDIKAKWDEKFKNKESDINGFQKMLEVVANEDDISFLRLYLTQDIVDDLQMFTYKQIFDRNKNQYIEIQSTDVKDVVESQVSQLYHYRSPLIYIEKAGPGYLELVHESTEIGTLDPKHIEKVMGYLQEIWHGVVNLKTVDDSGETLHFTYDEEGFSHPN